MSNTFNLARFLNYFKKHSIDNGKTYLLSTAVLIGILVLSLFLVVAMGNGYLSIDWQMTVLMTCTLLGGGIFTSLTFSDLGDKKKAIPALTLPVSHLEKYLVAWIYTYVIFLIVTIGGFYLVDVFAVSLSAPGYNATGKYELPAKLLDLTYKETPGSILIIAFTVFHALAFWGAIYFNKLHFIKTAFVFFICLTAFSTFNKTLLYVLTEGHVGQTMLFQSSRIKDGNQTYYFPQNPIEKVGIVIFIAVMLLLWVSAYFRLKEKQV